MTITEEVSQRSTCLRRQTGAIVVRDRRILATGYNGAPRGLAHCDEAGCLRQERKLSSGSHHELCRGLHAEQNAVLQAALYGVQIEESTLYSTHQPCVLCAKMLINAGIRRVVYRDSYPDELAQAMLAEAGILLEQA
ncbi:MAG: cytidine deaminase [Actinobacteria bacterium]|nr:MAG: cytidine deaminase [Actinomycetota bacterium]